MEGSTCEITSSSFADSKVDSGRLTSLGLCWCGASKTLACLVLVVVVSVGCIVEPEVSTVRMAYPHELVTMDPHAHVDAVTTAVQSAIYEGLVFMEPGMSVRPRIADRWTTPDPHTWKLHIREGVRFHDGSLLEPADAVASIERARASTVVGHQLEEIVSVRELPGERRMIEIVTKAPAPLLLTRLESVPVVPMDFDPEVPIGTGPYQWWIGSVQGPILLKRWRGYWGPAPEFDEVSIQFTLFQEDLTTLLHHQKLDVAASVPPDFVKRHPEIEGWRIVASPGVGVTYLGLNTSTPGLEQPEVRRAIDLAINRAEMVEEIYPPNTAQPAFSLVPPEVFGFSPEHRRMQVDPDRARQILAAARTRLAGRTLRLSYFERDASVAGRLLEDLRDIGLDVVGDLVPYDEFYRRIQEADCDLFLFMWSFRVPDASKFLDTFVRSRNPGLGLGTFNGARLADPQIDALVENATTETDSKVRLYKLQQAITMVSKEHAYLPLFKPSNLALVRDDVDVVPAASSMARPQDICVRR